jgi:hypothetical protein
LTQIGVEHKALTFDGMTVYPAAQAVHVKYDPVIEPAPATAVVTVELQATQLALPINEVEPNVVAVVALHGKQNPPLRAYPVIQTVHVVFPEAAVHVVQPVDPPVAVAVHEIQAPEAKT